MKKKIYHILNGDALLERFPEPIPGERIVARECLVDGDVSCENLEDFFSTRASFLSRNYGETEQFYIEHVVPEFQKIQNIKNESEINLWFEKDLFCQVNFWFVVHLLHNSGLHTDNVYLVLPKAHSPYSFAHLNNKELQEALDERLPLQNLNSFSDLWLSYQHNELEKLTQISQGMADSFPFISSAVEAHIQRLPSEKDPGRVVESLKQIMEDLDDPSFGPVFREFCNREAIYGFGDLQVKRIYDEILKPG